MKKKKKITAQNHTNGKVNEGFVGELRQVQEEKQIYNLCCFINVSGPNLSQKLKNVIDRKFCHFSSAVSSSFFLLNPRQYLLTLWQYLSH